MGPGNVRVTGGPGDATGSKPYIIIWVGQLAGQTLGYFPRESTLKVGAGEGTVEKHSLREAASLDTYVATFVNRGDRATEGELTIADRLPPGLVPVEMVLVEPRGQGPREGECKLATATCSYESPVAPGHELRLTVHAAVTEAVNAGELTNGVAISGGGAAAASSSLATSFGAGPAPFGITSLSFEATAPDSGLETQAAAHPYDVTTSLALNTNLANGSSHNPFETLEVAREPKEVAVELPLGFVGDPLATERCPEVDLTDETGNPGSGNFKTTCPRGSQVGVIRLDLGGKYSEPKGFPVYNVVPEHGYPAELGFNGGLSQPVFMYASVVPSPAGYRLRVASPGILRPLEEKNVEGFSLTVFGDPGAQNETGSTAAFLSNPTRCGGERSSVHAEVTAWEGGAATAEAPAYTDLTGCNLLQGSASFDPALRLEPETTQADTPSGYQVDLRLPQGPAVFGSLATPELRNASVTLPAGVAVSPSSANGLGACTPAQIDLLGTEVGEGHPGGNGSAYDDGLTHASPGSCPEDSRLATVTIHTPLLEEPLEGHLFLAMPQCGGAGQPQCTEEAAEEGKVFGLYLEAAGAGVIVKLAGTVEAGGFGTHSAATGLAPGQLRARFDENPQLPFEDLKLTFPGGPRASLANPQSCEAATTTSVLEPWSAPESPNATPASSFSVTGCGSGFAPSFQAGTVSPLAGAFSPFTLTFSRHDREQDLSDLTLTMAPGLLGALKGVERCPEPQASKGECAPGSLIGHDQVAAGSGSLPLWETGQVFLTGPYKGAPFGLSIVTPAVAGPFNLGNVVVRASISVNPATSQITATSDPLPQLVNGVPLRIKTVTVTIDRPGFIFNPTNCERMQLTGSISGDLGTGAPGATVGVSSQFAAAGCRNLPFKPVFTASTLSHTSKQDGASLHVGITSAGIGQANIHKVELTIPNSLPSRLTTLQKACGEAQFNTNPAGCPPESDIATAIVHTPLLNGPLSGPVYFVSHGGAAFPDTEIILQGEGIELVLDGHTDIKKGVTYSRFEAVPDAPFTSFEFNAPEGPYSIFAAYGNLCTQSLAMPTTLTGQNGAVLKQSTPIEVTGCGQHISITKKKLVGKSVSVTVSTTAKGLVTITGNGLRRTSKTLGVGSHTIDVPLTATGRTARKKHHKIKIKAALTVGKKTVSKTAGLKL